MAPSFTPTERTDTFSDLLSTLLILAKGQLVTGVPYWAYMAMKPSMAKSFAEARKQGVFDLEEYGTILEWGEGAAPPSETAERMKRDYGMQPDFEERLLRVIRDLG